MTAIKTGTAVRSISLDLHTGETEELYRCVGEYEDGRPFDIELPADEVERHGTDAGLYLKRTVEERGDMKEAV